MGKIYIQITAIFYTQIKMYVKTIFIFWVLCKNIIINYKQKKIIIKTKQQQQQQEQEQQRNTQQLSNENIFKRTATRTTTHNETNTKCGFESKE